MRRFGLLLFVACAASACSLAAFAQGKPMQLPSAGGSAAGAAIGRAAPPPKISTQDDATIVQRANAWLNSSAVLTADFKQTGADGKQSTGKLYVQKAGRLRFMYDSPATLDIVADGLSVAVRDRKLATQDLYFINQTPLKFLLKKDIDLAHDTKIVDVNANPAADSILIEDSVTFGGTSRIRLVFDPKTFALRQWTVTDPQGYQTLVQLSNLDLRTAPDPSLFQINQERFVQ